MFFPFDPPRLRVLLADVEREFFAHTSLLLEAIIPRRFVLDRASTYGAAATVIRRQRFDLCLISSYLGSRSGMDLAIHIKANYPATPVIMLVGSEELADLPASQPMDYLDRDRLSVEMLRPAVRDAWFRSMGGAPLIPKLAQPVVSGYVRAAARLRDDR